MSRALLVLITLSTFAFAATARLSISVNGRAAPEQAIVVDGKTYVPLSALKLLGVNAQVTGTTLRLSTVSAPSTQPSSSSPTAPGGANQISALTGCQGETLFNGLWRFTVVSVEPLRGSEANARVGWAVNLELRNGAQKTLSMMNSGFGSGTGTAASLVLPDGTTLENEQGDFLKAWSKEVIQGGVNRFTLRYYFPRGTTEAQIQRPTKFIMQIDPRIPDYMGVKYTVTDPSFRVQLDCRK